MQAAVVAQVHHHLPQEALPQIEAEVRRKTRSQKRRSVEQDHRLQVVHQSKEVTAKRKRAAEDDQPVQNALEDQILNPNTGKIGDSMITGGDQGQDLVHQEQEALVTTDSIRKEEGVPTLNRLVSDTDLVDDIEFNILINSANF